jgi:hypothetical protein
MELMSSNFEAEEEALFRSLFFLFDISFSPLYHNDIRKESEPPFFVRQNSLFLLTEQLAEHTHAVSENIP